jgi:hypothetical protein
MTRNSASLAELQLANGLTIHFEDRSRPTPGAHLQVILAISIPLRVTEVLAADSGVPAARVAAVLGDTLTYSTEKVRNFVPEDLVAQNLEQMREEFLRSNLAYLERPEFPGRFLMKKYREVLAERGLDEARAKAFDDRSEEHDE